MTVVDAPFSTVFAQALRGTPCAVVLQGREPQPLPVPHWTREPDLGDHGLLALCEGPTLDVGCGPGRLATALADAGHVVLGIDVVPEAVRQTRDRGAAALTRDVFGPVPGEGRWRTALLADGNVGIGGRPVALLRRLRTLLDPRGQVVAELAPPGTPSETAWARLECGDARSRPFRWSVLSVDDAGPVAAEVGLAVRAVHCVAGRWVVVLGEER